MPSSTTTSSSSSGTATKQRVLSDDAINSLIYKALSSDQGLASLASGENLSGGFNSSTKTLQTQDFLTKLIGELATVTAPEVSTSEQQSTQTTKKKATVICTELARQGYLDPELYEAGGAPSRQVSVTTWSGYHIWAVKVVAALEKSPRLCRFLAPVVTSRYRYLTGVPGVHLWGRATVYIGHPICYLIGLVLKLRGGYGRISEFA